VKFTGEHMHDPYYLKAKMQAIQKTNQAITEFKVLEQTPQGFQVLATLDNSIGEYDTDHAILYETALNDPQQSYTEEDTSNGRSFKTARAITDPSNQKVIGMVYTAQTVSETDQIMHDRIRNSIIVFIITIILVMLLFFRHAKIVDYISLYKQLKEIDTMKDDFITMASHELRTPVTIIRGYADYLAEASEFKEREKKYILEIKSGADDLNRLVDDILNVSRLEQGRMKFEMKTINPNDVAREVVASFMHEAESKHLQLHITTKNSASIFVDPDRLKQILSNLVSNALKYTSRGEINVDISSQNNKVIFRVSDTGIGIAPEEQHRLFQKFHRVISPETSGIPGTGLGLWIIAKMLNRMAGTIRVESKPKVGSHFIVEFPIVPSSI
jgi:signal transduction histidine kinase